ncbi:prolyl oligopeptidase family protein [Kribbella sp. NPDC051620]|uniref:prolyl oligopeptidase family protein n=1 Tax=Kribbella sp. NPDC051620 TaxID=3364120 RepID=UPI00379A004B
MEAGPPTRRASLVGMTIADPHRWLETDAEDWVREQDDRSSKYLTELPEHSWFTRTMRAILASPRTGVPQYRAGWYLVLRNDGSQQHDVLHAARSLRELLDGGRVVVDPNAMDGSQSVDNFSVSADGRYLTYGTLTDGNPRLRYRTIELSTGAELDDVVADGKYSAVTWLPDNTSYLYLHDTDTIGGRLRLHRLGTPQSADPVVLETTSVVELKLSHDGGQLMAQLNESTDQRKRLWVYPVRTANGTSTLGEPVRLIDQAVANTRFVRISGDRLVLWTDLDAPRGRIVTCTLDDPAFTDLVPQGPHPLTAVHAAGDGVLTVALVDVQPQLQIHRADGTRTTLQLTGSAITAIDCASDREEILVGLSSTTTPTELALIHYSSGELSRTAREDRDGFVPPDITVLRRKTVDREVPYFLISRQDLDHDQPRPTLLYGYGGFNSSQLADYRPGWPAWLAAGGVLVIANLRGGGEFGAEWHDAGRLDRKQNTFDDCIAVAEHLQETGVTTRSQLAIHGHSGGGLLVGAMLTQRPDLFAAALPSAGVMDMLRFHLFTIGRAWIPEIGSPEDPEQARYLLAYSPLHNLRDGTAYPATLVQTSDHDEIVVPLHSYKFTATMQRAQAADEPVLLRVQRRVGHGPGRASAAIATEWADRLAFAAHHTGLDPRQS